jgi:intracellular sulfur oxidation DsrE/DsrF family protein
MFRIWLLGALACGSVIAAEPSVGNYRLTADATVVQDPAAENSTAVPGYVFDITVENENQLDAILNRAEKLQGHFNPEQYGRIALVLHGRELRLFQKSNYSRFMSIVDKARALDQQNLVDIKACQTAMEQLHINKSELPDFIEQVPLAPVEIERLQRELGYTRL